MKSGVKVGRKAEPKVVDEGAPSEVEGLFDCSLSIALPEDAAVVSALGVRALDEGVEALTVANGLSESCEVSDVAGNVEEGGVGEDIMCLKTPEVADDEPVLLALVVIWKADRLVTVLGGWIVAKPFLLSIVVDCVPAFVGSKEKPSILAFFDAFSGSSFA